MGIKEANRLYEGLLNGSKESSWTLHQMKKAFLSASRKSVKYETRLKYSDRYHKVARMESLAEMNAIPFVGLDDYEEAVCI